MCTFIQSMNCQEIACSGVSMLASLKHDNAHANYFDRDSLLSSSPSQMIYESIL